MATHPVPPDVRPAKPPRVPPASNSLAARYRRISPPPVAAAADAFIAIGGRLMIDPDGKFLDAISAGVLFGSSLSDDEAAANMQIARAFDQAQSPHGAVLALKAMVRHRGAPTANGWLVLEARS